MTIIKPITQVFGQANHAPVKADGLETSVAFEHVLKNQQPKTNEANQQKHAILNFYEVHQRSQITGVPTSEYNAAVAALGLDGPQDTFAAIKFLQDKGFDMGAPSMEAILKYGAKPQETGNQSYLAQAEQKNTEEMNMPVISTLGILQSAAQPDQQPTDLLDQRPDLTAVSQEIQTLNQKFGHVLGPSENYFEAVTHLSKQLDMTPYLGMTLNQALPLIATALGANPLSMTTDLWLQSKG